jgi:transposase-like protein
MYLAGISVRRVEDITEALWGARVSASKVSSLNNKLYAKSEAWRSQRVGGDRACPYLDGIVVKRSWVGEVRKKLDVFCRDQEKIGGGSRHKPDQLHKLEA